MSGRPYMCSVVRNKRVFIYISKSGDKRRPRILPPVHHISLVRACVHMHTCIHIHTHTHTHTWTNTHTYTYLSLSLSLSLSMHTHTHTSLRIDISIAHHTCLYVHSNHHRSSKKDHDDILLRKENPRGKRTNCTHEGLRIHHKGNIYIYVGVCTFIQYIELLHTPTLTNI